MKAVRLHQYGGPEVLTLDEIPEPSCKPNEVKIQVKACGLNHLDLWVRKGLFGDKIRLPHIPGTDVAGVIADVGSEVTQLKKGEEVLVSPVVSCGDCEHCLAGWDNLCRFWTMFGEHINGGNCESFVVPETHVVPKPANLSFEEAAAIPVNYMTAWHMLVTQGSIASGHIVLIQAAGSGVGSAAIQIAKLHRASVITTASAGKIDKARALGADHVIDYKKEDVLTRVKEITGKRGVDIVIEHTGEKTFEGSFKSLCTGGRLVTCGATTGRNATIDLRYLFSKHLKIIGSTMGRKVELIQMMKFFADGSLKPIVDRVFPLQEVRQAHEYLEASQQFGKVILRP